MRFFYTIIYFSLFFSFAGKAQTEKQVLANTSLLNNNTADTLHQPGKPAEGQKNIQPKPFIPHDPRKATRKSAIIPGWGQAYNKQYWKIPLVYGLLAVPTATFIFNNNWFQKTSYAYDALYQATFGSTAGTPPSHADSIPLLSVNAEILKGINAGTIDLATLQNARNAYRRDRDYSVFWFFLLWGLNVVDATVSGHLKDFNVSKDLSMHVEPKFNSMYNAPGLGLTFTFKSQPKKIKEIAR